MSLYQRKQGRFTREETVIDRTEIPFPEAAFAMELMENLAIVAATPDGESSDGRQKMRHMTPEEVVARATSIASIAFATFRASGLMLNLPVKPDQSVESEKDAEDAA